MVSGKTSFCSERVFFMMRGFTVFRMANPEIATQANIDNVKLMSANAIPVKLR
jgi:hypothetical protein